MKKAAGSLRIDLAQFREMEVFTQFSSDLDEETKAGLTYGKGLMELLSSRSVIRFRLLIWYLLLSVQQEKVC